MASSGPRYPTYAGTVARSPYDDVDWTDPANIKADDGNIAYPSLPGGKYSYIIYTTSFGFSLPDDATVNGIKVEVEARYRWGVDNNAQIAYVALRNTGSAPWGTAKTPATYLTSSLAVYSYGGDSDTWGLTGLTGADINASDFGVELACRAVSKDDWLWFDFLRVTVYYTEAAGGVPKHSDHYMRRRAA